MNRKDRLVVVLTRSFATGVGVIRCLGAAGYVVDAVASCRITGLADFVGKSRYVRNFREVISAKFHGEGETDEELLEALLSYKGKEALKPVLFPTDDYTASIMDMNRDLLADIFLMPGIVGGKAGSMVDAMDKSFQGRLAREAGILTPSEWRISLRGVSLEIPEDITYPCFVKPLESVTGYKKEMAVCRNRASLERHLRRLRNRYFDRSVLVQEYLDISDEIDFSGVALDQKIIIPAVIRKTCVAKYEKGVTLSGMMYPFEFMGDCCEKIIAMLQNFHYTGMFDMEFNIVGDKIYFNEVNLRSGGPSYAYFKGGANLPAIFVDEIVAGTHAEEDGVVSHFGYNFVYEKVLWEDFLNGFMSKETMERRMRDADFGLLESGDDPAPYKEKYREFRKELRRREIQKAQQFLRKKTMQHPVVQWMKTGLDRLSRKFSGDPQWKSGNERKRYNGRPRVLVAGRNYCSNLSIARSLGEAGYEVEVMHVYQTLPGEQEKLRGIEVERFSKYVKAYYVVLTKRDDKTLADELIKNADKVNRMLLIPADDLVAAVADKYYGRLKKYYILPNVSDRQGGINYLMSKHVQKKLAEEAGLPVLKSCLIHAERGHFEIPDTISYPCFIKPDVSRLAAKSRMHRCDSKEELSGWLTVLSSRKEISMLVEDYVDIVNEYSILGVSTKQGAIGPAAFVAVRGGTKEHRGVALTGRILDISELQPLAGKLIDFVGSLDFDGLYDIDLIEAADGRIYFVELNMRLGASGYAFCKCGVNLPGIFADYMIYHRPLDFGVKVQSPGKIFVSEKVLIDEYAGGRIEKGDWQEILNESEVFFIKNDTDPKPYKHFKKYFRIAEKQRNVPKEASVADLPLEERMRLADREAIDSIMKKTYWPEETAIQRMEDAREKYGISYTDYDARNLCRIPAEELGKYIEEQDLLWRQRNEAVASVMERAGWEHDDAQSKMMKAWKKYGISFVLYDRLNLWDIPGKEHKNYLACVEKTHCTEREYRRYGLGKMRQEVQNKIFLNALSSRLDNEYNRNQEFLEILEQPEQFYRTFRQFIRRPWCFSNSVSGPQFAETFEGCSRVLYRPINGEKKEIVEFSFSGYSALALHEKLLSMEPGLVEACLVQHGELENLSPGAMAKIRIVTIAQEQAAPSSAEPADIAYAVLRTGAGKGQNHQFYDGGLFAVIDQETGTVVTDASDAECTRFVTHPRSGMEFRGFQIPMFREAVEMVQKAIRRTKAWGYLGWDIVITKEKPVLISVTSHPAPVLVSAPYALEKEGIREKMQSYLQDECLQTEEEKVS